MAEQKIDPAAADTGQEAARKAVEALRESEEKFRSVFTQASDLILLLDIPPNGIPVIQDVNDAVVRLLGYSREELIGRPISVLDPGITATLVADRRKAAADGINFEVKHRCKDGTIREFDCSANLHTVGQKILGVSVERDITERRKAQTALIESEERYRRLFESAKDGILLLDFETGRITGANPFMTELLGFSNKALLEMHIWELGFLKDVVSSKDAFLQLKSRDYIRYEDLPLETKEGKKAAVEFVSNVYLVGGKKVIQCNIRDITERKQAAEALLNTQRRQKAILDNIPDMAWLKDKEGRFIAVNEAFGRSCGLAPEALPGKTDLDIWPKELAERYRADDEEVMRTGKRKQVEEPLATKEGITLTIETIKMPIFDEDRLIIGTTGLARDITERVSAEADRRESYEIQAVLNTILQHSLTPIPLQQKLADHLAALFSIPWLAVQPKGAVFLVTPGRTLTLTAQQGLAPSLLTACAKLPFGKCLCGRAAERGQIVTSDHVGPDHEITYEGIQPHGHYCAPIIAGGKTLGVLNLYLKEGTDITGKRKDFIQAVTDIIAADILHARVEEQFIHSQKMEAIGHMSGGVAHDFNNILTAIMGYADFLRAALPAGDPKCADVEEIIKAGERAAALTQQLLTFSRKQVVQFKVLDLDQIVPETVKMIRRMIAEDIEFKTFLNSAPANVLANQGQLGQVLINLAINARDAMPDGGTLTFETAQVELDETYAADHPGVSPGRYVMLAVSDTGSGMGPEIVERPGAFHRVRHRQAERRKHLRLQRARERHVFQDLSPHSR